MNCFMNIAKNINFVFIAEEIEKSKIILFRYIIY